MKISTIFKAIFGIGTVSGIVYAAYKCGVDAGKSAERRRRINDDLDFLDDEDDELDYDEPDDACLAPANTSTPPVMEDISADKEDEYSSPLDKVYVEGLTSVQLSRLYYRLIRTTFSRKTIREYLNVDNDKADEVLGALVEAGLIVRLGNYKYQCLCDFLDVF